MGLQSAQLVFLALVHVFVDFLAGALPAVLPAVRTRFGLSLTMGVALLTVLNLSCNLLQIATGSLRRSRTRPLFLQLGLGLGAAILLIAVLPPLSGTVSLPGLPPMPAAFPLLLIIVLVTLIIGFGAGFVLRPVIVPIERTAIVAGPPAAAPQPAAPRQRRQGSERRRG